MSENPLVLISDAERQLEVVTDIVDILEFRDKAEVMQTMVQIVNATYEVQQRVTLLRLKAERKAGSWLRENIQHGGSWSSSVTLSDLEVTKNQSSAWQLYARLPEKKFNAWVDERIMKGWELTSSGLRAYAKNSIFKNSGHVAVSVKRLGGLQLVPVKGSCSLRGYIIECVGDNEGHHLISKQMARGNPEVRQILRECPDELMCDVCSAHNVGKLADSPVARKILLVQKIIAYDYTHMEDFIDALPWKIQTHDRTLKGMLSVKTR